MTIPVTQKTLTDAMVREYRSALHEEGHTDTVYSSICDVALAPIEHSAYYEHHAAIRRDARDRVIAAINGRAKVSP